MTAKITDAQVESHIAKLREMAGSNDLKEMIRAELRYCDSAYAWHRRTREFCARFGIWYVTALTGIASGLGLHYWIADNFGPMAAGASVIAGLPIAICGFVWLCSH